MTNSIDKDDLAELNTIFDDMGGIDKVENFTTNNFEELPDGEYIGEIENVNTKNSKNTGRPMLEIIVAIADDKKEHIYLMLAGENLNKTKMAVARTVTQLKKLGVTGIKLEDFISGAMELIGTRVNLKIETNGSYRNKDLTLA